MNWRAWIHDALTTDTRITDDVPPEHVHQSNSLEEVPDYEPFILYTFLGSNPGPFSGAKNLRAQIWVHDRGGSQVRIDRILDNVRAVMADQSSADEFIQAVWEGDSDDTVDNDLNTNTRNATFRLAGKDN